MTMAASMSSRTTTYAPVAKTAGWRSDGTRRGPGRWRMCGRSVARVVELGAQLQDGLRVHLADPALGDAEHLPDLGQREAFVVVEGDDDLLPLRQRVDRA